MKYTTGFQELSRDLKKALEKTTPKEALKIVEQEGNNLAQSIRQNAPMQIIKEDIGVISKPGYDSSVLVGLRYDKGPRTNLAYAFEYGTVKRFVKPKKGSNRAAQDRSYYRGFLSPKPFFRPTVDSNANKVVTNIADKIFKLATNKLK
jgi:hypothetical protein